MSKIKPDVLQRLRKAKGWSQKELANKTEAPKSPKIDKQTISRLERGIHKTTRARILEQIARALGVDEAVLTGEAPAPKLEVKPQTLMNQLNVRIGTAARNQLYLVARRYGLRPSRIVELSPYLFVCAADMSLRQRQKNLDDYLIQCSQVLNAGKRIPHLMPQLTVGSDPDMDNDVNRAVSAEQNSINASDLFGDTTKTDAFDIDWQFNDETANPFEVYCRELASKAGDAMIFDSWDGVNSPTYRVCREEAADIVGGDTDAAEEILAGHVALNEMPKEIRESGMEGERLDWARKKAEEYRKELEEFEIDFNALFGQKEEVAE